VLPIGSSTGTELVLDVTIPVGSDNVDTLVVSSNQLSRQALIATVTEGLIAAGGAATPTTASPGTAAAL
jgi:hypothetical protein